MPESTYACSLTLHLPAILLCSQRHRLPANAWRRGYPPLVKTKRTLRLIPLQNSVRPRAHPFCHHTVSKTYK
ncbi:AaceriADR100Cp [[Ashbya] aceris (nom. inval.)]|nr:AaceriADR100Cp [[Ashbya] aceris (nom. inval.)]